MPAATRTPRRTRCSRSATAATRCSFRRLRCPGRLGTDLGLVGVRVVAGDRQILLGLAREHGRAGESRRGSPWLLFGLAPLATVGGPSLVTTPLLPQAGGIGARAVAIAEQYLGIPLRLGRREPALRLRLLRPRDVRLRAARHPAHAFQRRAVERGHAHPALGGPAAGRPRLLPPGSSGPGHVGIYIGGGEFIHAPHTGDVVKISTPGRVTSVQLRRRRPPVLTSRRALTIPALLAASAFCVLLVVYRRHHTGDPSRLPRLEPRPRLGAARARARCVANARRGGGPRRRARRAVAAVLPERAVPADRLHPPARVADDAALVRRADARRVRVDGARARVRIALRDADDLAACGRRVRLVARRLGALALASFGVYLGRFLRFNSWDALVRPGRIATSMRNDLENPFQDPRLCRGARRAHRRFDGRYLVVYSALGAQLELERD